MKCDIILSGVGGQGILSIAAVIGEACRDEQLNIKQTEVHGMSQRGGDVQANLRISSDAIASDLIPLGSADVIISLEPMEALRYVPFLKKDGWIVTSTVAFVNITNYPDEQALMAELAAMPHVLSFDVDQMAREAGAPKAANIILLGIASSVLGMKTEALEDGIRRVFGQKGEAIVEMNIKAFEAGVTAAIKLKA